MSDANHVVRELEVTLEGVARRTRNLSAQAAFRATVEARLGHLESELAEIKTRINGLLFFVAGTVITQVALRLLG